jgi:ribonuclease HII
MLKTSYELENYDFEIGIDEAGRGPLLGRVYAAAAILPKDNSFNHKDMKDSKKFTSKKKINDMSNYIKENAIVWSIQYEDEKVIDQINILQATYSAMHKCIKHVKEQLKKININKENYTELLMVDGKFFKQYTFYKDGEIQCIPSICIEKGDNAYTNIAAASILAKVARDDYIEKLCEKHSDLITKYKIDTNKGYGSKHHINGIKEHGICQFHRKTFGLCKTQELNNV